MIVWEHTPFKDMCDVAEHLYGEIECDIKFNANLLAESNCYGRACLNLEGKRNTILLDQKTDVLTLIDVLAHELAHVITGIEDEDHSDKWMDIYQSLVLKYNSFSNEKYKQEYETNSRKEE
jgi:hypothetical protein